jgi:hypothetical protein
MIFKDHILNNFNINNIYLFISEKYVFKNITNNFYISTIPYKCNINNYFITMNIDINYNNWYRVIENNNIVYNLTFKKFLKNSPTVLFFFKSPP